MKKYEELSLSEKTIYVNYIEGMNLTPPEVESYFYEFPTDIDRFNKEFNELVEEGFTPEIIKLIIRVDELLNKKQWYKIEDKGVQEYIVDGQGVSGEFYTIPYVWFANGGKYVINKEEENITYKHAFEPSCEDEIIDVDLEDLEAFTIEDLQAINGSIYMDGNLNDSEVANNEDIKMFKVLMEEIKKEIKKSKQPKKQPKKVSKKTSNKMG